ncbi:hypothetical protein MYAM1_000143 [Malassezia yamatoensis]|uniref:AMMECR1 domain-containing protein n=1 Tax=Malassezia yamatoensis TaxID=253288 RepID=A0AAJ5YQP4_9BASI|nr:hypothetical protein MYAM1_000143 [Malassezia yamatoensis]
MSVGAGQEHAFLATPEHCYYCFQAILAELDREEVPRAISLPDTREKLYVAKELIERSLFVSWNEYSTKNEAEQQKNKPRLRGCIGTFQPQEFPGGLARFARQAAFHDTRFSPISKQEVPRLDCAVSLLSPFESCKDYLDWQLGFHGVYIEFKHPLMPREELTATFLPEVATAQSWSKQQTIDTAIRKAGWNGAITQELLDSLRVSRYTSSKCNASYAQYLRWKQSQSDA